MSKAKIAALAQELAETKVKLQAARAALALVKIDVADVWLWQGGGDHLDSLTCPVVMSASALRKLLATAELGRLTVPRVLPLVREYLKTHPGGGALHVWLQDGNIDDDHMLACRKHANQKNDRAGRHLAALGLLLSKTQRKRIYHTITQPAYKPLKQGGGDQ